ncbi:MAG TPA: hypothetical protein VN611_09495 [Patescibacteria group bacterium]|nr:hypothetical protein [Patescibacteria group bacterium]
MFSQYFGQYLLNKKILTPLQLEEVLRTEHSVRVKLGVLAINNGQMTAVQVEEIHEAQRCMDRKFGEIAIEKGYLTQSQLDQLLESQKRRQISLSQTIVDHGLLSLAQLENALANYKKDSQLTNEQLAALQSADIDSIIPIFADFSEYGPAASFHSAYLSLLVRNMVRLLNEEVVLSHKQPLPNKIPHWLISQNIIGSGTLFTGLAMDNDVLLEIARRFSEEEIPQLDDFAQDSVAEFLNVNNGIFIVNMSDQGTELDLTPLTVQEGTTLTPKSGCCIPLTLSFGKVDLLLAWS